MVAENNKTFIGCFLNSCQICRWLGLPPRPTSTPNERYIWYKARKCPISVQYKSIAVVNCHKLEMKVWGHHVPFRFWFYKCNKPLSWSSIAGTLVCTTLLVSQLPVCILSYFCLHFDNWLTFNFDTSKNMIIILEFPNGKNVNREIQKNVTDHTCKWRKPSFTASTAIPRMLLDAKPWLKSTCCRFEIDLRKIPGCEKCILLGPVGTITWPGKYDLCAKLYNTV